MMLRTIFWYALAIPALAQERATGDWGGARTELEKRGVDIDLSATQFMQGVTSGGTDTGGNGTGKLITDFKIDLGKLAGWNFWSVHIKTETRYGGPILTKSGGITPVNTQSLIPGISGTVFSITSFNVTKLIPIVAQNGDFFALSGGRYNVLDLFDDHFYTGAGLERFMNLAQVGPMTVLRQIPLVTTVFSAAWVRKGQPFLSIAFIDPNDHSTNSGIPDMFTDGVTISPSLTLPAKYGGKTAKHTFTYMVTTKKLTPFSAIPQLILPSPPANPVSPQRGSWSAYYAFTQYFVERGKDDGWGLFSQLGFADRNTGPVQTFFDVGLGGNGLFHRRREDEFGIAYAYNDLSNVLKDNLSPLGRRSLLAEHQGEMFYNLHLASALRLTLDLQVVRPVKPSADVAIIPGGRLQIIF